MAKRAHFGIEHKALGFIHHWTNRSGSLSRPSTYAGGLTLAFRLLEAVTAFTVRTAGYCKIEERDVPLDTTLIILYGSSHRRQTMTTFYEFQTQFPDDEACLERIMKETLWGN